MSTTNRFDRFRTWLGNSFRPQLQASAAATAVAEQISANVPQGTPTADSDKLTAGFSFTAPVELQNLTAAEGQEKKLPTFDITAYTGVLMQVGQFYQPVVVELSGLKAARPETAVLLDHDPTQIVGQGKATIDAAGCRIAGQMTGGDDDVVCKKVKSHAINGFKWQASIGATVTRREFLEAGKRQIVNGREVVGPCIIAREAILNEVSFVALGADGQTSAAVAASFSQGDAAMDFDKWLQAKGWADASAEIKASLKPVFDAEVKAGKFSTPTAPTSTTTATPTTTVTANQPQPQPTLVAQPVTVTAAAVDPVAAYRAEVARVAEIQKLCAGQHAEIEAKAIKDGISAEACELLVLRAGRGNGPAVHIAAKPEEQPGSIEAALCINAGCTEKILAKSYSQQVLDRAMSKPFRSMTITAMYGHAAHAAGVYLGPGKLDDDKIRACYQANAKLLAAGSGFSTLSLTNILENVAHKTLINSYEMQDVVWPFFCSIGSNSDFKPHNRYRLDATGAFKKVAADGELKHIGLADAKYTSQLDTYGCVIVLTRQMQIDDDLQAFVALPKLIGELAAIRQEEAAFVLLLSNPNNFFHANNRNLLTGAGNVMGIAGITAAQKMFSDQVNVNNKPILTQPRQILCGTGNFTDAETIHKESLIQADTGKPAKNPHVGKYLPKQSPYLNNTAIKDQDGNAISGQSNTLWFLTADPAQRAAVTMAFLNGQRQPTVRSAEVDMQHLGVAMQAFQDFGASMEDTTAAVMVTGVNP